MSLKWKQEVFDDAVDFALAETVLMLQDKIIDITPRDPKRPPKNPKARVTGNLKRSIAHLQIDRFKYIIGTQQGFGEYGKYLEFGTIFMEPRSFLRKGIFDNIQNAVKIFNQTFARVLK